MQRAACNVERATCCGRVAAASPIGTRVSINSNVLSRAQARLLMNTTVSVSVSVSVAVSHSHTLAKLFALAAWQQIEIYVRKVCAKSCAASASIVSV